MYSKWEWEWSFVTSLFRCSVSLNFQAKAESIPAPELSTRTLCNWIPTRDLAVANGRLFPSAGAQPAANPLMNSTFCTVASTPDPDIAGIGVTSARYWSLTVPRFAFPFTVKQFWVFSPRLRMIPNLSGQYISRPS